MKFDKKVLISIMLGIIISIMTNVIAESFEKDSKNVYYKDNSGLLADNVQDAIDGTCTKFDNNLTSLKREIINEMYPVGSIYISTTLNTKEKVKEALGGEWAIYGDGRTLLSSSGKSEQTGGANTVTLTTDNLPSHNHPFTPAGSVASTFAGKAVNTTAAGSHSHAKDGFTVNWGINSGNTHFFAGYTRVDALPTTVNEGNPLYPVPGNTGSVSDHTHSVTAAGTVTSTFTGTASNTGATGGGKSFSVQDAYITVYMYKRTA